MKNPITYVQGPPGTGKTTTILSVVLSAFFNEKSCLIVSNNNKPVDAIYTSLINFQYYYKTVPFPIIRLGNNDEILKGIKRIEELLNWPDEYVMENKINDIKNKTNESGGNFCICSTVMSSGKDWDASLFRCRGMF